MAISLGFTPIPIAVQFSYGGEFVCNLVNHAQPWENGTHIELRFAVSKTATPIVWPATISGNVAAWDVSATGVQAVIDAEAWVARLHYIDPSGNDLVWGVGRANAT